MIFDNMALLSFAFIVLCIVLFYTKNKGNECIAGHYRQMGLQETCGECLLETMQLIIAVFDISF